MQPRAQFVATTVLITAVMPSVLWAQPYRRSPLDLMSVRPHPASVELVNQAASLYGEAHEELERYEENLREEKYKAASARQIRDIGDTSVKISRLDRIAGRLALLVEPAGVDLAKRADDLRHRLGQVVLEYRKLPKFGALTTGAYDTLKARATEKERQLPTIKKFISDENFELAEERLHAIYDELIPGAIWFEGRFVAALYKPFKDAEGVIDAKLSEIRTTQAESILDDLRQKQTPPLERFLQNVNASADAIGTSGKAPWGNTQLAGPDLIAAWAVGWRIAHQMGLRAQALDWARGRSTTDLENEYDKFQNEMQSAVARVIQADASRATPDTARDQYVRYLNALARLHPQLGDPALFEFCEPALAELRGKSPELTDQVENYMQATDDLLRWRRRLAARLAHVRKLKAKPVGEPMQAVAKDAPKKWAEMYASAPALIEEMNGAILGKQVTIDDLAPVGDGGSVSRCANRLIARTNSALPEAEVAGLREDLLVSSSLPPLTLAATSALYTAQQGYVQGAGGEVTGVQVDSVLGHRVNLKDDTPQFPWASLPPEPQMEDPTKQLLWFVDLKPRWLQHEYLFVELPESQ